VPTAAAPDALKSVWAQGLKQPQGMAWLGDTLYVAEYGGGQVSKWSRDGKSLGAITGLKSPAWVERVQAQTSLNAAAVAPDEIYISERKANRVLRLQANGETVAVGETIEEPLGLDNALYVAEEGAGRVVRLNRDGSNTPVADGLGAPRDIEFQDAKTMLVSDKKGGNIWKVVLN
jgi:glucose/arabinose dehydrogenase